MHCWGWDARHAGPQVPVVVASVCITLAVAVAVVVNPQAHECFMLEPVVAVQDWAGQSLAPEKHTWMQTARKELAFPNAPG